MFCFVLSVNDISVLRVYCIIVNARPSTRSLAGDEDPAQPQDRTQSLCPIHTADADATKLSSCGASAM